MFIKIRALAYKAGIRPKRGSVLYSSTLHDKYTIDDMEKALEKEAREGDAGRERLVLYDLMRFCVFCAAELEPMDVVKLEVKECPKGCGSACADIDTDGSAFIAIDR